MQLCCGNIQMTLESAWIYEIYHFQLKFVSMYRKEVTIIAITYFLATLPILTTKIAITRYLVIVSIETSCINNKLIINFFIRTY